MRSPEPRGDPLSRSQEQEYTIPVHNKKVKEKKEENGAGGDFLVRSEHSRSPEAATWVSERLDYPSRASISSITETIFAGAVSSLVPQSSVLVSVSGISGVLVSLGVVE